MLFLAGFPINSIIVLLSILVFMVYLYFKRSYTYWSSKGVITPPCSFPLGNLNDAAFGRVSLQEMFKEFYTDLKPKGIPYFGYYLLHRPVLVVLDMELIKAITVKDFAHFSDHGIFDKKDYDLFGGNLFALTGTEWKNMREKLTPLFSSGKLKIMFPTIKNCSIELATIIDKAAKHSEKLDIKDIAARYTTDIIASVAFGIESNSLKNPDSDFLKYGKRAVGCSDAVSAIRLAIQTIMPDLTEFLKITMFPADSSNFYLKIVESTIKYREENNIVRKDFMQLMIQLKNNVDISDKDDDCFNLQVDKINNNNNNNKGNKKDFSALSIEEIVAQTMLFFFAAFDSSSVTISFCMYELAYHQDIQARLRDEIKIVLKKHAGKLSYDAIMEMAYLDKCIKETLRKYSLLTYMFRRCTKTYKIPNSDLTIEKDMIVFVPINELHYDPEYFPNPNKFDPERFSTENISSRNPVTWLGFGVGPRACIGARFAMIQMKVALVTLLKDFRYSLDTRTTYPLKRASRSLIIAAEGGIWLNVEKIIK